MQTPIWYYVVIVVSALSMLPLFWLIMGSILRQKSKKTAIYVSLFMICIIAIATSAYAMSKIYPAPTITYTFCGALKTPEGTVVVIAQDNGYSKNFLDCLVFKTLPDDLKLKPGAKLTDEEVHVLWADERIVRSGVIGDRCL